MDNIDMKPGDWKCPEYDPFDHILTGVVNWLLQDLGVRFGCACEPILIHESWALKDLHVFTAYIFGIFIVPSQLRVIIQSANLVVSFSLEQVQLCKFLKKQGMSRVPTPTPPTRPSTW
jgi:hypothetical protein